MSVVVDARDLKNALKQVRPAVPKRISRLPILNCVRLRAVDGLLEVSGTDLMLSCKVKVPAEVSGELDAAVSLQLLSDCISGMRGDVQLGKTPDIPDDPGRLTVAGGRSTARITALPVEDWPTVPEPVGEWREFNELPEILAGIKSACGIDTSRAILTGIYLTDRRAYASDTHRLHVRDYKRQAGIKSADGGIIIAPELVQSIGKLIGKAKALEFQHSGFSCWIRTDSAQIGCRLIEGKYPNAEKVISPTSESKWRFTVSASDLCDALASLVWSARENSNRVTVALDGDQMLLSADSHVGAAEARIPLVDANALAYERMAFSAYYLHEAAALVWPDSEVTFEGTGSCNQVRIYSPKSKCFAIVMPMQVEDGRISYDSSRVRSETQEAAA